MSDYGPTKSQIRKLDRLMDFIHHPEKYGCRIDKGDPETYQDRVGKIIEDADGVVDDLVRSRESETFYPVA
jgi:hypothetical protein